jgi:hypothetical protein
VCDPPAALLRKQCGGKGQDAFHIACFWSGFEVFAVQALFLQAKRITTKDIQFNRAVSGVQSTATKTEGLDMGCRCARKNIRLSV